MLEQCLERVSRMQMTEKSIPDWQVVVLLPGKSHGRRSLVGCSPWGH